MNQLIVYLIKIMLANVILKVLPKNKPEEQEIEAESSVLHKTQFHVCFDTRLFALSVVRMPFLFVPGDGSTMHTVYSDILQECRKLSLTQRFN
jgi:hypothetical protein